MEFLEKAKTRLEHWVHHNEHHGDDYEEFAKQLEEAGKPESASHIRDMIELTKQTTECLQKALDEL